MISCYLFLTLMFFISSWHDLNGMDNSFVDAKISIETNKPSYLEAILQSNPLDANRLKELLLAAAKANHSQCFSCVLVKCSAEKLAVDNIFLELVNKHNAKLLKILLSDHGVQININGLHGEGKHHQTTPLIFLVKRYTQDSKAKACIKLLLNRPDIDLMVKDSDGKTFLDYADNKVRHIYLKVLGKKLHS